jgi:hypothetical protein
MANPAANYPRPDATFPAIAEHGGRVDMSPDEIGEGWSTTSQTRPPAIKFNSKDWYVSSAMKYICRLGVAEYSPDEIYQGLGMCVGSNGSVYWNLAPCTGIDPVGDATGHWELMPCRRHDAEALIRYIVMDMIGGYGYLTEGMADLLYLRITDAEAYYARMNWVGDYVSQYVAGQRHEIEQWTLGHFALQSWVEERLANYATNEHAQNLANNAQNAANAHTEARLASYATNDHAQYLANTAQNNAQSLANAHTEIRISDVMGWATPQFDDLRNQIAGLMPTGSIGGNGWIRMPNGLIFQWVQGYNQTQSGTAYQAVNFPMWFPHACLSCQVTTIWTSGPDNQIMIYQTTSYNNGLVNLRRARRGDDGVNGTTPQVFAVGY